MNRSIAVGLCVAVLATVTVGQSEKKPWSEWSLKDATKILNDSPWGQTQLETKQADAAVGAVSSNNSSPNMKPRDASKDSPGAITSYIKYFIRFLSAKPVRQAFVRKLQIENPSLDAQKTEQLKAFAETTSDQYIVIAVSAEAKDQTMGAAALQAFRTADLAMLKRVTYLERKDGQRLELADFRAPIADGLGAKFVFPRTLNSAPFLDENSGQVRFYCQLNKNIKIEARYKVADMMYNGKLEY